MSQSKIYPPNIHICLAASARICERMDQVFGRKTHGNGLLNLVYSGGK